MYMSSFFFVGGWGPRKVAPLFPVTGERAEGSFGGGERVWGLWDLALGLAFRHSGCSSRYGYRNISESQPQRC